MSTRDRLRLEGSNARNLVKWTVPNEYMTRGPSPLSSRQRGSRSAVRLSSSVRSRRRTPGLANTSQKRQAASSSPSHSRLDKRVGSEAERGTLFSPQHALTRMVHSIDELYAVCESEHSRTLCSDALHALQVAADDFGKLRERVKAHAGPVSGAPMAWETRKPSSPTSRLPSEIISEDDAVLSEDLPCTLKSAEVEDNDGRKQLFSALLQAFDCEGEEGYDGELCYEAETLATDAQTPEKAPRLWSSVVRESGMKGRSQRRSTPGAELHKKFSSPERRRLSATEAKLKQDEKQRKADEQRRKMEEERRIRLREFNERVSKVIDKQAEKLEQTKMTIQKREKKADKLRQEQILGIQKKANSENTKVKEIEFINKLSQENLKHELWQKYDDAAMRKTQHLAQRSLRRSRTDSLIDQDGMTKLKDEPAVKVSDLIGCVLPPVPLDLRAAQKRKLKAIRKQLQFRKDRAQEMINVIRSSLVIEVPIHAKIGHLIRELGEATAGNRSNGLLSVGRLRELCKMTQMDEPAQSLEPHLIVLAHALITALPQIATAEVSTAMHLIRGLDWICSGCPSVVENLLVTDRGVEIVNFICTELRLASKSCCLDPLLHVVSALLGFMPRAAPGGNGNNSRRNDSEWKVKSQSLLARHVIASGLLLQLEKFLKLVDQCHEWYHEDKVTRRVYTVVSFIGSLASYGCAGALASAVYQPQNRGQEIIHAVTKTTIPVLLSVLGAITCPSPCDREGAEIDMLPNPAILTLHQAICALNNIARLDLQVIQALGSQYQIELYHTLSYLLRFTKLYCCSSTLVTQLLQQMLLFIGYYSLLNEANQESFRWGQPTLLELLCDLPFSFFIDQRGKKLLFPTLIALSFRNAGNCALMQDKGVSTQHLCYYIEQSLAEHSAESNSGSFCEDDSSRQRHNIPFQFANRFPTSMLSDAASFYRTYFG